MYTYRYITHASFVHSCCPKAAKGGSRPSSPSPASELLKPCLKVEELYPDVFQMLFHLGPHVHADPVLLAKLLRIGRAFLKERASTRYSDELPSQEKVSREDFFFKNESKVI